MAGCAPCYRDADRRPAGTIRSPFRRTLMHSRAFQAISVTVAALTGAGVVFGVTELGATVPGMPPVAESSSPATAHARLVPVVRTSGRAPAPPGAEQPVLAEDLQTPPPATASPSGSASRPAPQRSGQPHQSATPTTAAPSPTATPPFPAPTPSPRPSPSPSQTSPAPPPFPASTCLVSVSALGLTVCAKIGG
jgi:hypothetical protein